MMDYFSFLSEIPTELVMNHNNLFSMKIQYHRTIFTQLQLSKHLQVKLGSIEVTNGGRDGTWGLFELCPSGSTTIGVSLRVDYTTSGDQRGVTGIKLHCNDGASINETFITSSFVE